MDHISSSSCSDSDLSHSTPAQPKPTQQIVSIARSDRWQAYHRLQELGIPCTCLADGRLQVEVTSPMATIQLWSVLQQLTQSRQHLLTRLERCWNLSI